VAYFCLINEFKEKPSLITQTPIFKKSADSSSHYSTIPIKSVSNHSGEKRSPFLSGYGQGLLKMPVEEEVLT
jgi:hypothetical protein